MFNTVREFRLENGNLVSYVDLDGVLVPVAYAALPGSQAAFFAANELIVLFEGTRGGCGKTLSLILDFCQFVGLGMGAEHKGIILRRTFPQLAEVIALSRIFIPKIYPDAVYNEMAHVWKFPDGATLEFSHMFDRQDFERYQGRSFTWIGIEEAANFPNQDIMLMLSCLRSAHPQAVLHFRLTTNTIGVGRDWLMEFFHLPLAAGAVIGPLIEADADGPARRVIHGRIEENLPLMFFDPGYMARTLASTTLQAVKDAWSQAIWAALPSALFGDCPWQHVKIANFKVPSPSRIRMSYDHGSGHPFVVLFWWESDGDDLEMADGKIISTVRGSYYLVAEIYGGHKNVGLNLTIAEIARRIHALIESQGWDDGICRKLGNIADGSIFDEVDGRPSIATEFSKSHIDWERADKSSGSVLQGIELLRKLFIATKPDDDGRHEDPGLYVCERCANFLRTVPHLQRDDTDLEKPAKHQDDHAFDAGRYFVYRDRTPAVKFGRVTYGTSPRLHGSIMR